MKRLYLVRHGKSSWKDPDLPDMERPLNKRGKRDAPRMGKRLNTRGIEVDGILSSPAKRALRTARLIAREIGFPVKTIVVDEAVYTGDVSELLEVVRDMDASLDKVMLFGHNPALTMLANYLTGYDVPPFSWFFTNHINQFIK